MKAPTLRFLTLSLLILSALTPFRSALAHGEPVIDVQPAVVPVGGEITVTGAEMEPGEVFVISLESSTNSIPLGEAAAAGEGEEGGFVARFTIPVVVAPGSYVVRAATEEGETATADLTVTEASTQASAAPAMVQEPTGELHALDRTKPAGQIIGASLVAFGSLVLGVWLVRKPG